MKHLPNKDLASDSFRAAIPRRMALLPLLLVSALTNGSCSETTLPVVLLVEQAAAKSANAVLAIEWCPLVQGRSISSKDDGVFDHFIPDPVVETDIAVKNENTANLDQTLSGYSANGKRFKLFKDQQTTVSFVIRNNLYHDENWPLNRPFDEKETTLTVSQAYKLLLDKYYMADNAILRRRLCSNEHGSEIIWSPFVGEATIRSLIAKIAVRFCMPGHIFKIVSISGSCSPKTGEQVAWNASIIDS